MLKYKPWSEEVLEKGFDSYRNGSLSILDIELSGTCNFNCVYCDSPDHSKRCTISINDIARLFSEGSFEWVFICGLGEPTAGSNYKLLIRILTLCQKYDVKCSIFSNVLNLTSELLQYVDEGILYVLFKFDSSSFKLNSNLYGTSNNKARTQYKNIKELARHVKVEGLLTNIGASIVPTKLNVKEIPHIIEYCLENNIYPLIGDLENSGRGQDLFAALSLSEDELIELKENVESLLGSEYRIPICPAVVSGIHISHDSRIVVDQISGLTCPWFWLEEPRLQTIMEFSKDTHMDEIIDKIISYRNCKLKELKSIANQYTCSNTRMFGGCGGDIQELLNKYIEIQTERFYHETNIS